MTDALLEAEEELVSEGQVDCSLSGCTAVACLVQGDSVVVMNVGDSRAVMCIAGLEEAGDGPGAVEGGTASGQYSSDRRVPVLRPQRLSRDHKPTERDETRRILIAGGELRAI